MTEPTPTQTPAPEASSGARKAILITTAVIGGLALLGVGASATVSAIRSQIPTTAASLTADARGVTELQVDAAAADFTLEFADVDEAQLESTGSRGDWTLRRSGDELIVTSPDRGWNLFDWCIGWCDIEESVVTLTLPQELERTGMLDASLNLSSGMLRMDGSFRDVDLDVSAGSITASGEARSLTVDMSAGRVTTDFTDVTTATYDLSAGSMVSTLRGTPPDEVSIDVSAGSYELTLPDAEYRVVSDVSAGSFDNQLATSSTSRHGVLVDVSAGRVTLTPES